MSVERDLALWYLQQPQLLKRIEAFNRAYKIKAFKATLKSELESLYTKFEALDPALCLFKPKSSLKKFSFLEKKERLVLVNDEELSLLVTYLGASRLALMLVNTLLKEQKECLLTYIDAKVYNFVLTFARFMLDPHLQLEDSTFDENKLSKIKELGAALLYGVYESLSDEELRLYALKRLELLYPKLKKEPYSLKVEKLCYLILKEELGGDLWIKCLS